MIRFSTVFLVLFIIIANFDVRIFETVTSDEELLDAINRFIDKSESINNKLMLKNEQIKKHHQKINIIKTVGTSTGTIGASLTVVGILLAPYTGGLSLATAGWGLAIGTAGAVTNLGADIADGKFSNHFLNEIQKMGEERNDIFYELQDLLQRRNEVIEEIRILGLNEDDPILIKILSVAKYGIQFYLIGNDIRTIVESTKDGILFAKNTLQSSDSVNRYWYCGQCVRIKCRREEH
jgi:hypothetical protein